MLLFLQFLWLSFVGNIAALRILFLVVSFTGTALMSICAAFSTLISICVGYYINSTMFIFGRSQSWVSLALWLVPLVQRTQTTVWGRYNSLCTPWTMISEVKWRSRTTSFWQVPLSKYCCINWNLFNLQHLYFAIFDEWWMIQFFCSIEVILKSNFSKDNKFASRNVFANLSNFSSGGGCLLNKI